MIPVEGHKNLYRDEKSGAIINTNSIEFEQYMKLKAKKNNEKSEIESLKKDVELIKSMLIELSNKIK